MNFFSTLQPNASCFIFFADLHFLKIILASRTNDKFGFARLLDHKFRESVEVVCEYPKSDQVEIFLKSYSLKTEFNKKLLSKFQLSTEQLSSTAWFRKKSNKYYILRNNTD